MFKSALKKMFGFNKQEEYYKKILSEYSDDNILKCSKVGMGVWLNGMEMHLFRISLAAPKKYQNLIQERLTKVWEAQSRTRRKEYEVFGERIS